jgi:opacity protein-like surface antigen
MRRASVVTALLFVSAFPLVSEAGSLDMRVGGFFPRLESNLWVDDSILYQKDGEFIEKSDWYNAIGGLQYNHELGDMIEVGLSTDFFQRTLQTSYRDFVGESGREIQQTLKFNMVPVGVQIKIGPTRRGKIAPYIAAGGDMVFYTYEEFGDFIDFDTPSNPIIPDSFRSEGTAFGFHGAAGIKVPIGDDFSIVGEGRYLWAKDDMSEDFRGNEIDLSGWMATIGVNLRF